MYPLANIDRRSVFMKDFQLCIRLFSLQVTPPHSQSSLSHTYTRIPAHIHGSNGQRVMFDRHSMRVINVRVIKSAVACGCPATGGGGREGGKRRTDVDPIHTTLSGDHILANCDTELRPNDNKSTGQADVFASRSRTRRLAIVCPVHDA